MSCNHCTTKGGCSSSSAQQCQPVRWRLDPGKVFRLLAIISLVIAYFLGQSWNQPDWQQSLQGIFPDAQISKLENRDDIWRIKRGNTEWLAALGTENSYGGPLSLAAVVDTDGKLQQVAILTHTDTPAYIQKLQNHQYFRQYIGVPAEGRFKSGEDFDIVSGATLSSNAIMRAAATGSHHIARTVFNQQPEVIKDDIKPNYIHGLIVLLLVLALANLKLNNARLKVAITLGSLVVLGFLGNQMISVANFAAIALGYIPSLTENLSFWLVTGSVLLSIILLGRNIYCGNICPFHGVQYLLSKVGGLSLPLHPLVRNYGKNLAKFGLWAALMVAFLSTNPSAGAYEPFGMIFSLQGEGIQWYILPATVIGCFFVPNLFCRYLCPAGEALTRITNARNQIIYAIKGWKK